MISMVMGMEMRMVIARVLFLLFRRLMSMIMDMDMDIGGNAFVSLF